MHYFLQGRRRAFTLIELLITIGIIGILASIVIIAINPTLQLQSAEDAKRRSDLRTIADAVYQFVIKEGRLPEANDDPQILLNDPRDICSNLDDDLDCFLSGKSFLGELAPIYIADMPVDPDNPANNSNGTSYEISLDQNGRVVVSAPLGDNGLGITVTR